MCEQFTVRRNASKHVEVVKNNGETLAAPLKLELRG
jgi:hypothetical protein